MSGFLLRQEGGARPPIVLDPAKRYTLGRGSDADLSFPEDTTMSRLQAMLAWNGTAWVIENKSQHGSFVGSEKVDTTRVLAVGEVLAFGTTKLVLERDASQ